MSKLIKLLFITVISTVLLLFISKKKQNPDIKLIAIANYGPHTSLNQTIEGMKLGLKKLGYIEGKNINYEISDVNFDTSLIIQMLQKLRAQKPDVIITLSTPVSQTAKNIIKDVPLVFANVTDPIDAGLVNDHKNQNITGISDKQDISLVLKFAKNLMPNVKSVGLLYSTGEANDISLLNAMKEVTKQHNIELVAIPIEQARDVTSRMVMFRNSVDFIYTGPSGVVQTSLPAIVSSAESMNIAVINFNAEEVIENNVLASYGVSYNKLGINMANMVDKILQGEKPKDLNFVYPNLNDYEAYINKNRAQKINFIIPKNLTDTNIVE